MCTLKDFMRKKINLSENPDDVSCFDAIFNITKVVTSGYYAKKRYTVTSE
jgi:hypothetical protein